MPSIVTLTMNPALDIATETEAIVPAHKLRCDEPRYDPGGGINVARAVHMLAGFPIGGPPGEMLCRLVAGEGVVASASSPVRREVSFGRLASGGGDYAKSTRLPRGPASG